jgi:hypothetical protein
MVTQLHTDKIVSDQDRDALTAIVDAMFDANSDAASSGQTIEAILKKLQGANETSPVAVAVASIALDSIQTVAKEKKAGKGTSQADLAGALVGGNIGSKGGLVGGVLGAVIGGVGMSYMASRDHAKS